MRRAVATLFAVVLVTFSFASCGTSGPDPGRSSAAGIEAILGATGGPGADSPAASAAGAGAPVASSTPVPTLPPISTVAPPLPSPTPSPTASRTAATATAHPRSGNVTLAAPRRSSPVRFVALGDSLTAWPAGNPWPRRVDAGDPSLILVRNAGVPGNTTAQMRARAGRDAYAYRPGLLVILGGTNDVGYGISQAVTIANLRAIVDGAKSRGIRVVLLTIPPDSFSSLVGRVRSLNAAIRALARAEGVGFIDIYTPLATPRGIYYPGYTVDGLHFSNLGTQVVANTIRAGLARLGL